MTQPGGVSTFRDAAEEEGPTRPEGSQQGVGEAKKKCLKAGSGQPLNSALRGIIGCSKMDGGDQNDQ